MDLLYALEFFDRREWSVGHTCRQLLITQTERVVVIYTAADGAAKLDEYLRAYMRIGCHDYID